MIIDAIQKVVNRSGLQRPGGHTDGNLKCTTEEISGLKPHSFYHMAFNHAEIV